MGKLKQAKVEREKSFGGKIVHWRENSAQLTNRVKDVMSFNLFI